MTLPWQEPPLNEWSIIGMNHYFLGGDKHLFVGMTKGDKWIRAEGPNEEEVFSELRRKAYAADPPY